MSIGDIKEVLVPKEGGQEGRKRKNPRTRKRSSIKMSIKRSRIHVSSVRRRGRRRRSSRM
jgi:hypothetical protein